MSLVLRSFVAVFGRQFAKDNTQKVRMRFLIIENWIGFINPESVKLNKTYPISQHNALLYILFYRCQNFAK